MARRPQRGTEADPDRLRRLIGEHKGSLREIGRALGGISRQAVAQRLARAGLQQEADVARAAAGISGPRPGLTASSADPIGERTHLIDALAQAASYDVAAKQLGISRRTLCRKVARLGIDQATVTARRQQHA